ncbi:MAG: TetR/AcrR family transcriptional regulator [Ruminococcaceae bacterium]|nr:TetR/AcrR family transcriptional regulator [Oscillospiraceae bacterium]
MKQDEIRRKLISGTIHVIARDGLDKATTKQIGIETSINEAYIYRCFEDKEDLFAKTFDTLDDELVAKALTHVPVMYIHQMEYEMRCWAFFVSIWKFILGNRDKCLAFIRYYYSPYFVKYSAKTHKTRFIPLVEKFKDAFLEEANVWMILNHILNTMLDFAVKVYDGDVSDTPDTAEHVFRVIYHSVKQYFKKHEERDS